MPQYVFGEGTGADASGRHKDTSLDAAAPNDAYGSAQTVMVGDPGAGNQVTLLRFDIASIPATDVVTRAILRLVLVANDGGGDRTIDVYRVLTRWGVTDFDEGVDESPASAGQATAVEAFDYGGVGDVPWVGVGGFTLGDDTPLNPITTFDVLAADIAGTAYDIDITAEVANWHAGAHENHGLAMTFIAMPNEFASFNSQEALDATVRPALTVTTLAVGVSDSVLFWGTHSATAIAVGIGVGL